MSRKIIFLFLPFFYKYFRTEVILKFFFVFPYFYTVYSNYIYIYKI